MRAPALPSAPLTPTSERWLWTCRAGFEPHLFEELAWAGAGPRLLGPALVESDLPALPPAFARMGFLVTGVTGVVKATGKDMTAELAARLLAALPRASEATVSVLGWAPDADRYAPLQALAKAQADAVTEALGTRAAASPEEALTRGGFLGQLCLLDAERMALGVVRAPEAWSLAPGGRQRMWREAGPSRAALKLEEALTLSPLVPGRGEVCADLGAAPGGWTQRLLSRGARVIAVDPAKMAPELMKNGKLRHVQESAFAFEPEEPVDWLFCDMAWRPLEVAQLLAKWARRGWADALVANLKLPMKDKNPIVFRARHLLEAAGWTRMTIRQLYHDRDEVTVIARRS